jgi:hypothetical protein
MEGRQSARKPVIPLNVRMARFRFTLWGLLGFTFWAAVALCPWGLAIQLHKEGKPLPDYMAIIVVAGVYAPFVAVGSLFGKTLLGLKAGVFVVGMAIILGGLTAALVSVVLG